MRLRAIALAGFAVVSACAGGDAHRGEGPLMAAMRSAPRLERVGAGRLSVETKHRPCDAFYIEGAARGAACRGANALGKEWAELGARIAVASERGIDRDALHGAAVMDLLSGSGNSLSRSISFLEMTARLDTANADALTDLSAAYLDRADRDGDGRSLVAALDASLKALEIAPADAAAQFNAALCMYRLGLYGVARSALARFVQLEPGSPWADEARIAIATLSEPSPVISDSALSDDSITSMARSRQQEVRIFAWNWLAGWGDAFRANQPDAAEHWLSRARVAGLGLAEQGDSSIASWVASIMRANNEDRLVLAAAHRNFADGVAHQRAFNAVRADSAFEAARMAGGKSLSLTAWALFFRANNYLGLGRPADCERELRGLLQTPEFRRDRLLAARAWWTLGVVLERSARLDEARGMIERARVLFLGINEREYAASMLTILAEIAGFGNDARRAYDGYGEALRGLRDYPRSLWRHNTLLNLAAAATADGMAASGDVINAEDAIASALAGRATSLVEVQMEHARQARAAHDVRGVVAATQEGARLASALPQGAFRTQLETELELVRASTAGAATPSETQEALDTAIVRFGRNTNLSKLLDALTRRAQFALSRHDRARAERDLSDAVEIYATRRASVASPVDRSLLAHQASDIVNDLTMLRVERGDAAGALAARERVRAVPSREATGARAGLSIEYTLVRDTLVALIATGGKVEAVRTAVDGGLLVADVELAVAALERRADESVWSPPLERLHARLVKPVLSSIPESAQRATVVADGILGRVPFAALRDASSKRFLVEQLALRFSSTPLASGDARSRNNAAPKRALVVGEPALDRAAFPWLAPLTSTGREMQSVTKVLPEVRRMRGSGVDRATLRQALEHTELFHFAGHAVFDDARPERSLLAVAPRGLSARDIAAMRLPTLRLVVLSACETDRSATGAGAGFLGLAESFLSAGAGGVVGSLWRVDDEGTASFMDALYGELAKGWGDPVAALARAQRSMVQQSPSAWAAFRYAGR